MARTTADVLASLPPLDRSIITRHLIEMENGRLRIRDLEAEVERLRRDYALFEELSPPDVPRATFVAWCFRAWEEANEARVIA